MKVDAWADIDPTVCPICSREGCEDHLPAGVTGAGARKTERFQRIAEGRYVLSAPELSTDIEVARIRLDRGETRAQVRVFCGLKGAHTVDGVLFTSEITLSRFSGRKDLASALGQRTRAKGANWHDIVDELAIRVERAQLTSTPVIDLATVPLPAVDAKPLMVGGFWPMFTNDANCIYSDGGLGKSLLATWGAGWLAQHGVPPLLVDYEMNQDRQAERLGGLFGADRPHVAYYRASRPLIHEAERLESIIHEQHIRFVVVDSAVPASSGSANDAEAAAGVYAVLRHLGVGSLVVAHVTKASTSREAKPEDATPYGSAFWRNLARSAWLLRRANDDTDGPRHTLGLFHGKYNYGKQPAIGVEVEFSEDGRIRISKVDAATVPDFAASLSVSQRLRSALKRGPRSIEDLITELDEKPDTVKRCIRRYSTGGGAKVVMFQRVGEDMVALAERRNA